MKRRAISIGCVVAAFLLICLVYFKFISPKKNTAEERYFAPPTVETPPVPIEETPLPEVVEPEIEEKVPEPEEPYVSPVDFEGLCAVNKDIYAWLDIPGTEINYPILQSAEDDTRYLTKDYQGNYDFSGSLFTEATYNSKDFEEPMTIVYGHNMNNGVMFATLQKTYSSQKSLEEHSEIVIYLPDRELHYQVIAAVPYDNRHILYNYDFSDERIFRLFFKEILSTRAMEAFFAEDPAINPDDQALLLSTCLIGSREKRFIVCGKLSQTIS